MSTAGFVELIAPLEAQGLSVTKYNGLQDTYPRLVWREAYIQQQYAGDRACVEYTTIYADLYTQTEDDPLLDAFKAACHGAELPFEAAISYDETTGVILYSFRITLDQTIS